MERQVQPAVGNGQSGKTGWRCRRPPSHVPVITRPRTQSIPKHVGTSPSVAAIGIAGKGHIPLLRLPCSVAVGWTAGLAATAATAAATTNIGTAHAPSHCGLIALSPWNMPQATQPTQSIFPFACCRGFQLTITLQLSPTPGSPLTQFFSNSASSQRDSHHLHHLLRTVTSIPPRSTSGSGGGAGLFPLSWIQRRRWDRPLSSGARGPRI